MSKFFTLIRSNRSQHRLETKPISPWLKNTRLLNVIMLVMILFTGLGYILLVNLTSTKGFQTKVLNEKIVQMKESNRQLELAATDLQSLNNITAAVEKYNLVKISEVEYLPPTTTAVALAE